MILGPKSASVALMNENLPDSVPVKEGDFLMPESEKKPGVVQPCIIMTWSLVPKQPMSRDNNADKNSENISIKVMPRPQWNSHSLNRNRYNPSEQWAGCSSRDYTWNHGCIRYVARMKITRILTRLHSTERGTLRTSFVFFSLLWISMPWMFIYLNFISCFGLYFSIF